MTGNYPKMERSFPLKMTLVQSNTTLSKSPMMSNLLLNLRKMSLMRDLDNIVTVKSMPNETLSCFFRFCLPFSWERSVYQLERSMNAKGSRVKMTLVSGVIIHLSCRINTNLRNSNNTFIMSFGKMESST